jgi:hypothetical protein
MNPAALLGGLRPVPFIDPLEIQQQQAQTSIMRDKAKASRQDMADEDAVRGALQASGGKMDDATFAKIAMANPRAAQALAKMAHDSTNSQYQAQESALKAQREQIAIDNAKNEQRALRINAIKNEPQRKLVFDGIKDPEERAAYEAAGEYGTESWKNFQDVLTRSAQDAKTQAELASRQNEDGYKANAEQRAAAAEAYQETLRKYNLIEAENRAKDSTRDPVTGLNAVNRATVATRAPEADPQSVREFKYAQTQGYKGTYQQYQNEDANRRAPRISVSAGGGDDKPLTVNEAQLLGVPVGTSRMAVAGMTPKKAPTAAQGTIAGYAARIKSAGADLDRLSPEYGLMARGRDAITPDILNSDIGKSFDRAQRDVVNAILRRESGAVISDSEFANAKKQYIPVAGDSPQRIAEKKRNRDIVLGSYIKAAGAAYEDPQALVDRAQTAPGGGGQSGADKPVRKWNPSTGKLE